VTVITEEASGPQANSVAEDMVKRSRRASSVVSDKRVAIDSGGAKHSKSKTKLLSAIDKDLESKQGRYFLPLLYWQKSISIFFYYIGKMRILKICLIWCAGGQGCERAYMVSIFLLLH
jgi:hypothetical protein